MPKISIMLGFHCRKVIGSCKYFHFTKTVILMVFLAMELKINLGFSTSCKHCHSSPSSPRAELAVTASLSETDVNPSPTSNSNWPSILEHALLCLHLHRPFPRGLSLTVLIEKGSGLATGMGGTLGCPACFSCALLITKLRCIHCWKCRKLQNNNKNSKKQSWIPPLEC